MKRFRGPNVDPDTAARLRAARDAKGLTLVQAAFPVGVSTETLYNWEVANTEPKVSQVVALARLYEVTPNDLLGVSA